MRLSGFDPGTLFQVGSIVGYPVNQGVARLAEFICCNRIARNL